jgi:hypothetical protein
MSSTTRAYVKGDDPMYRSVTPYQYYALKEPSTGERELIKGVRYAGPYATIGPAKASRGPLGWVEVCHPVWEKLEE